MVTQLPTEVQMVTPQIFKNFMITALDSSSASMIIPTVLSAGQITDKTLDSVNNYMPPPPFFYVLLTVHLSIFILVINQLEAQNLFSISLFHASTRFEHTCSSSGGQNCIIQPLVSSHLRRGMKLTY